MEMKKGEAVWELFTSECVHLTTLSVLSDVFLDKLILLQNVHISSDFNDIDVVKLFANIKVERV